MLLVFVSHNGYIFVSVGIIFSFNFLGDSEVVELLCLNINILFMISKQLGNYQITQTGSSPDDR